MRNLCLEIEKGAEAAVISDQFLETEDSESLKQFLQNQPPWSDFPLIVLKSAGTKSDTVDLPVFGNMVMLQTPVWPAVFINNVLASLRDRKRQYKLRDDIQEREAGVRALEERDARNRTVIDTALDAFIMSDAKGFVTEWNQQAEYIFGWSREEALGQEMSSLIIPEQYRTMHKKGLEKFLATGEHKILNQRIEITALNKAGQNFPVELTVTPHKFNGELYFSSFTRDITKRLKLESDMKESRDRLELMLESARDFAIMSLDPDGIIVSWNSGAANIFGYDASEVIGTPASLIFTPEDVRARVPEFEMAKATKEGRASDERWHLRKNGERFYASGIMSTMFGQQHEVRGYIKIAHDRTRQKEAEEAIIAARNAAEAANMAKTEFLANMSHEIRTPMNAVIGLANIIGKSRPLTPKQRDYIETLQMSADSLLALLNDLLDISKIETRTVELEHVPFSLTQLVQEVISMTTVRAREKGIGFKFDGECIEHRGFVGDPTRLRQIMLNLVSNSVKFTDKGEITIRVFCRPSEREGTETICIVVEDTGIGIAEDKIETIFEKFVQADSSINRKYGGSGLGLAITKTLVEIMGGTITLESEIDKGTVFTVCLPLAVATPEEIRLSNLSLPELSRSNENTVKPKVLLVEDNEANIMVAGAYLDDFGYSYEVAANGVEAVEKIKSGKFSAILMDVQMHGMNGFEATHFIRRWEEKKDLSRIPIIGMTAHALAGDRERCISIGMDDYIAKPFDPEELREKLTNLIS